MKLKYVLNNCLKQQYEHLQESYILTNITMIHIISIWSVVQVTLMNQ